MKQLMTAVVPALFALSTGVAFAAEPAKKDAAATKPAASAPVKGNVKGDAKAAAKPAAKAEPAQKKEKKGGC
jgi:hypothetical protein